MSNPPHHASEGLALTRHIALLAATLLLALTAFVGVGAAASAAQGAKHDATPCWKVLTNDAFDGKVDGIYPTATYGEAVKHLPTDVQSYSTIAQVITQARQDALQQAGTGVKPDPARCGFVLGSAGSGTGTTGNANGNGNDKGPIPGVIDSVGSGSADSFPVALIVIAGIAVVLLLGGGAGFLLRRKQRHQQELEQASGTSPGSDDGTRELTP